MTKQPVDRMAVDRMHKACDEFGIALCKTVAELAPGLMRKHQLGRRDYLAVAGRAMLSNAIAAMCEAMDVPEEAFLTLRPRIEKLMQAESPLFAGDDP